ncbi:MAG: hypothetical protein E7096_07685 [Bacteroides sp.]|nr:hypothetical protein [Bacteroides sp.]
MKKLITITLLGILFSLPVRAQEEALVTPNDSVESLFNRLFPSANSHLSAHMNLEFYTSAAAYFTEGSFDEAAFKINRVRMEILGSFSKEFSWHFRQSFNKYSNPHALDNLSSSIEYAYVNWKPSAKFNLTVGKQFVSLGGYEYYLNANKVREFSEFNDYVAAYQAGISAAYNFSPTQELVLQVTNSRSGEDQDMYVYGRPEGIAKAKVPVMTTFNWNGLFADKAVQLRYAASWGQQAKGKNILYLTAGNTYEKGPVIAYVDVMYSRQGLDSHCIISDMQGFLVEAPVTAMNTEYLSIIADFDYRIHPNWNVYVKGAYETAGVYETNGWFEKGLYRTTWNLQGCVEFFPMRNSELKIFGHLLHKGHKLTERARALGAVSPDTQRISVGLVYTIPVF